MLQISTVMKAAMIAALPGLFNGGHIRLFSGLRPTYADRAEDMNGATLLGYITNGGIAPTFSGSGLEYAVSGPFMAADPFQSWVLTPSFDGEATWFRVVGDQADSGGDDYSAARIDGDVGTAATELILPSTTLVFNTPVAPISFFYTIPPILG